MKIFYKSISFFVVVLLCLASCSKENSRMLPFDQQNIGEFGTISVNDALTTLGNVLSDLYEETRANDLLSDITIDVIGGVATRSDGADVTDTTAYLVNFGQEDGYAILAAKKAIPAPVLCVTESGHISKKDLDPSLETLEFCDLLLQNGIDDLSGDNSDEDTEDTETSEDVTDDDEIADDDSEIEDPIEEDLDFVSKILGNSIIDKLIAWFNRLRQIYEEFIANSEKKVGPLLLTKWGQKDPFNGFIDTSISDTEDVGCVVTAISQILVYNKAGNPDSMNFDWELLETVRPYSNPRSIGTDAARKEASRLTKYVSEVCRYNYYKKGKHSGNSNDARRTFKKFGYSVKKKLGFCDKVQQAIIEQLNQGRPVYEEAMSPENRSGHAWVIDGYYNMPCKSATGQSYLRRMFHVNWGWSGASDGYYDQGVFEVGARVMIEQGIDSGVTATSVDNYSKYFRTLLYSL